MSQFYRITLTPLDTFFFGGETTFGQDAGANYFAVSNRFPQQTTLLGLLRHQILMQNDAFPLPNANATDLIGENSFDAEMKHSFGSIKHLSPIVMQKAGKDYFVRSREFVLVENEETKKDETQALTLGFKEGSRQLNGFKRKFDETGNDIKSEPIPKIPFLSRIDSEGKKEIYNPKEHFAEQLIAEGEEPIKFDDVFKEFISVNIVVD